MFIKNLLKPYYQNFKLSRFQEVYRKQNRHNYTSAQTVFPLDSVSVGNGTYGDLHVYHYGHENEFLQIKNYCSIAKECKFIGGGGT